MKKIGYSIITLAFLFSCEEVPIIVPDANIQQEDTTVTIKKVVLLEELTGASCPNCPAGTAALEGIFAVFEERVVSTAIHGKFLAQPTSKSMYDFRNDDAKDLENFLAPFLGKPAAAIDRVFFEDQTFMTVDDTGLWQSFVQKRLQEPALLSIELSSNYNESERKANVTVNITAVEDILGFIKLSVIVNENHIIDAQSDQGEIIDDYEHNHVMREMLTSISGDVLGEGILIGDSITRNFSYSVPAQNGGEWIPENMEIIAFVTASNMNNQVIQATKTYLK